MKIENGEPPKTPSFPLKFALHWFFPLWNKTKFIHISYFSRCLSAFVPWYPKIYPTFRLPPASHDANQSWFTATGRQQKSKEHENWKKNNKYWWTHFIWLICHCFYISSRLRVKMWICPARSRKCLENMNWLVRRTSSWELERHKTDM
jgi:hypothetical protein